MKQTLTLRHSLGLSFKNVPLNGLEKGVYVKKENGVSTSSRTDFNLTFPSVWFVCSLFLSLVFSIPSIGQSTNCGISGSLLSNGTFEGSSLSGWSVSNSANANFDTGYDGCGTISLRLSRGSGSGLLDPALWQQENNIESGKIYTLAFDAGTKEPSGVHRVYIRFYNALGILLSEDYLEVNHDVDANNKLKSYSFSVAAPATSSYLRVAAVLDSDRLYLDNICLVKSSCIAPTFNFQSPSLISGSYGAVGSQYEVLNIATNTNAIITIESKSHSDIVINTLDEPASTNGGYDWAFQPIIDYNWYNGWGYNDPAGEKSVTFRFDFIDAQTGLPVYIPQLNMTAVDVDGNSVSIREFVKASNFQSYEIQSPTELTLSGSLKAKGGLPAWDGVTETALSTMISYVYNGQSSVTVTYGGEYNGGSLSGSSSEERLNCLFFKCYDFNSNVVCPTVTVSGGNDICSGGAVTLQASHTGGSGTCSLQWQSSANGTTWNNISGATGPSYTTNSLTATTYYRATYTCSGNSCGTIVSSVETVAVLSVCTEICNNNIDDDGDGYIDEEDAECANYANCEVDSDENVISGTLYNDANGNQTFDNGEYTPSGVTVQIYEDKNNNGSIGGSDLLIATLVTDANGNYSQNVNPNFDFTEEISIGTACNDARDGNNGENRLEIGKDKTLGLRFTGIDIPAGATITSAYLYFVAKSTQNKTGQVTIYAEDNKTPKDYCQNNNIVSRSKSNASISWNVGNWVQDQTYKSKDIKSLIQELVDDNGKYGNGEMAFILVSNGADRVEAKTWETNSNGTEVPRLVINYHVNTPVNYLAKVDVATLPLVTSLTTPGIRTISFNATGQADCNINFGFEGTFEQCGNGFDDDFDGYTDEEDEGCFPTPVCNTTPGQNNIFGTVYQDPNRNQMMDNGDHVEEGISLKLYRDFNGNGQVDAGDTQLANDVSDANGQYSFTVNPVFSATQNASISSACDDGRDGNYGENKIQFGKDKDIGLRFTGITIPAGSTITSAYLYFTSNTNQSNYGAVSIYANDYYSPFNFCFNNDVDGRTRTTASANWTLGNWTSGIEYQSADIKNVVQELVDSYTYSNGVMTFLMISTGNNNVEAKSYETNNNGTQVPRLVINFSPSTSYSYVVELDATSLPAYTDLTTPNLATATFLASGTVDCNNDFGFASTIEICNNGIDDDGDGLADCADSDCYQGLSITANNPGGAVCPGATVTLSAGGSGGTSPYTFTWSNGLGNGASKNVNPLETITYSVTLTDANGCTDNGLVSVEVQPCPENCSNGVDDDLDGLTDCEDPDCNNGLSLSISGGGNNCFGQTNTYIATATGGITPYTYSWSHGLGNGATKNISPSTTTTYTVTVTSASGCSKTAQFTVKVSNPPTVGINSNTTICSGATTTLSATATGYDPFTYEWSNGLGSGNSKTVNPNSTATYIVTVTDANGCTSTKQTTVTVNPTPIVNAGVDVTICKFSSTTLTASAIGGAGPYTYSWSNGLGSGASKTVSPTSTKTYTVTATSSNGCNSTDQITVTVQNCPENCGNSIDDDGDGLIDCADSDCGPQADLGAGVSICQGLSTTLSVTVTGGIGMMTYNWSNGLGTGQSKTVSPTSTTTYVVTVTAPSGCSDVAQTTVTVNVCSEDCTNGIDDDGDGLVDCDDPDCSGVTAPLLMDDSYTTCPGIIFTERVTYNDGNLQNPAFDIVAQPMHGLVNIDWTGKFIYMPLSTECTTDIFIYEVCNQTSGCCSEATVTLNFGDNTAPELKNVPDDLTIGCDDVLPSAGVVTAFDHCPGVFIDYNETTDLNYQGACGSYTITRTWTATDLCGNTSSEQQKITVVDQTKPEIFQVYTLADGTRFVAGVSQRVTQDWKYVPFPITFSQAPVVLTTLVTNTDLSAVTVQERNIYTQGFQMRLKEEDAADQAHAGEKVAWLAIEPGSNYGDMTFQSGNFANVGHEWDTLNFLSFFSNPPMLFTALQTNKEKDATTIRHRNLNNLSVEFYAQEETSLDAETNHQNETLGFLAVEPNSRLVDKDGLQFGEMGQKDITNAWTTIALSRKYTKPVVIVSGLTNNDGSPVNIRVRNVNATDFQLRLQEWDYLDGNHGTETVSWMVVEGSIPGNGAFYCSGKAAVLQPGVNVFAMDNCDDVVAFGFNESPASQTGNGLLTLRTWMAIDDCGNTSLVSRYDTCATAALQVKALLYGAVMNNYSPQGLMRDNLRQQKKLPVYEPYSKLPGFNHIEYGDHGVLPQGNGEGAATPEITICHKPGTSDEATMTVHVSELALHLGHGDMIGSCGSNNGGLVTICHKPGTPAQKTMVVPQSALLGHLGHGDFIGSCGGDSELSVAALSAMYRTIADGLWSDAATWENGNVPPTTNINNKTISVEHKVTIQNSDLHLKNSSTLWVTHGGITLLNGVFKIESSSAYFSQSILDLSMAENVEITSSQGKLNMTDCTVMVGQNIKNQGGKLKLENVSINVGEEFINQGGVDSLINVCAVIQGDFKSTSFSSNHFSNVKFQLPNGKFENNLLSSITGDDLVLLLETEALLNLGTWTASILQYCVAGSLTGLLSSVLPINQDCVDIANYFNPCNCYEEDDHNETVNNGYLDNPINTGNALEDDQIVNHGKSFGGGSIEESVLDIEGDEAIVDWLVVELRSPEDDKVVLGYSTVLLQRDGQIVGENLDSTIAFPGLPEGEYYITIRHRNHLGMTTDVPFFLSSNNVPQIDFTDVSLPIKGGVHSGKLDNGKRTLWSGDFSEDGKVIYQGPYNDIFNLFSRVLSDPANNGNLANYIVEGYELEDLNLDGQIIYQGPNNDRFTLLYHTILSHPLNINKLANYIVKMP